MGLGRLPPVTGSALARNKLQESPGEDLVRPDADARDQVDANRPPRDPRKPAVTPTDPESVARQGNVKLSSVPGILEFFLEVFTLFLYDSELFNQEAIWKEKGQELADRLSGVEIDAVSKWGENERLKLRRLILARMKQTNPNSGYSDDEMLERVDQTIEGFLAQAMRRSERLEPTGEASDNTCLACMTDGSSVVFSDTDPMPPTATGEDYEIRYAHVPVGERHLPKRAAPTLTVEAEFGLYFPDGVPETLTDQTRVYLVGIGEGKNMEAFVKDPKLWKEASIRNNVMTSNLKAIPTSLGALRRGEISAEVCVTYDAPAGPQKFRATTASLAGKDLAHLVAEARRRCKNPEALRLVNLGLHDDADESEGGLVNRSGPRIRNGLLNLFHIFGGMNDLRLETCRDMAQEFIDDGLCTDGPVKITIARDDKVVGRASITQGD